jgi:hypothetical protein
MRMLREVSNKHAEKAPGRTAVPSNTAVQHERGHALDQRLHG